MGSVAQTIPDNIKSLIKTYVGLLIGDHNLSVYACKTIKSEEIPAEMQDEKNILRAIEMCVAEGLPAKAHFIEAKLAVNDLYVTPNAVTEIEKSVGIAWRADVVNSLRLASLVIRQWRFETDGVALWKEASDIMNDPAGGSYADLYDKAYKLAVLASPTNDTLKILDDKQLIEEVMKDYNEKRRILLEKGTFPTPVPHLSSLAELGVSFSEGEFSLLLGNEGAGKSSFAQQLAHYVALEQGINYDVLYVSLETSKQVLGYRRLSQACGIPFRDFMMYRVDETEKAFLEVYNHYLKERLKAEAISGYVRYAMPQDKSASGIIDAINKAYFVTSAAGRKLMVIIDHIGRIELPDGNGSSDANKITNVIIQISNACNSINSHVLFVGHVGQSGKLFGATYGNKAAQLVLVLEAEKPEGGATNDELAVDSFARPMADYLGRQRFFQMTGNTYGSEVTIKIEKANNLGGGSVRCKVERPMGNKFYDIPTELERIKRANES